MLVDLAEIAKKKCVSPYRIANIHTALGDKNEAFCRFTAARGRMICQR